MLKEEKSSSSMPVVEAGEMMMSKLCKWGEGWEEWEGRGGREKVALLQSAWH